MHKIRFFQVVVLTLLLSLAGKAGNAIAIGMITEPIVIDSMLRGGEVSKTVTVFNPQKTEAVYLFGSDGGIKGWVTFFEKGKPDAPITKVNVPATSYYDVIAKIKVPDATPNGEYVGEIFVKQAAADEPKESGSSVSIAQMVSRQVKIKVTDQEVVKLDTALIPEAYDVKQGDPLKIKIIYENFGNIALKPSFQLKIINSEDGKTVFNAIYPYPEAEAVVNPGERKTMPVQEWPTTGQPAGRYLAEASTLVGGETLQKNEFRFSLEDKNVAGGKVLGTFISAIGGGEPRQGWAIIACFVTLSALVYLALKKRKPLL